MSGFNKELKKELQIVVKSYCLFFNPVYLAETLRDIADETEHSYLEKKINASKT